MNKLVNNNDVVLGIIVAAGAPKRLRLVSKSFQHLIDTNAAHIEKEQDRLIYRTGENAFLKLYRMMQPGPRKPFEWRTGKFPALTCEQAPCERVTFGLPCSETFLVSEVAIFSNLKPEERSGFLSSRVVVRVWIENLASCKPEKICLEGAGVCLYTHDCLLLPLTDQPIQLFTSLLPIVTSIRQTLCLRVVGGTGMLQMHCDFQRVDEIPCCDKDTLPIASCKPERLQFRDSRTPPRLAWKVEGDRLENIYIVLRKQYLTESSSLTIIVDWQVHLHLECTQIKSMLMPEWKAFRSLKEISNHRWCREIDTEKVLILPIGNRLTGYSSPLQVTFSGDPQAVVTLAYDRQNTLRQRHGSTWLRFANDTGCRTFC